MTYQASAVMRARRDSREERDLKKWLRSISREERFAFICECLEFGGYALEKKALDYAAACIADPDDAMAILRRGLVAPDAGSIRFWLEFGIAKLGGQRVVNCVAELLESAPSTVDKALYWLPRLLPPEQPKAAAALLALRKEADRRGIVRGPRMTTLLDGSVVFSDIYPEDRKP